MYKVTRASKNGKMLELINDKQEKEWYFLAENVVNYVRNGIKVDDEVEIKTEESGGDTTIVYITKKGGVSPGLSKTYPLGGAKTYGKSPEEQEAIRRMSVLASSANAVATALQGQVNVDALADSIVTVYDRLYAHITK